MTDFQINLTIDTYFETLINRKIDEKNVKNFYQKNGILNIELEDNTLITKQIKNFSNSWENIF